MMASFGQGKDYVECIYGYGSMNLGERIAQFGVRILIRSRARCLEGYSGNFSGVGDIGVDV